MPLYMHHSVLVNAQQFVAIFTENSRNAETQRLEPVFNIATRIMAAKRSHFAPYRRIITWVVMLGFAYLPLVVIASTALEKPAAMMAWAKVILWAAFTTGGYFYARQRCSSDKLVYQDGLYLASYSSTVWGMGASFLLMMPVLASVFLASIGIAAFNDIRGKKDKSPENFYRLIVLIYRNRMIQ